ncbi:MAG: hypothetical protein DRG78_23910 [Epsilonproteobacteria bacterium]|nr:MAG: hypothetical protein DRG78_23910 [Campylobacterota bacterium]
MELSQVNSLNINSINEINSTNATKVASVDKNSPNILPQTDKVEISSKAQSSFSSNIISNIDKISNLQKVQVDVKSQIDTANSMAKLTTQVVQAPKAGQVLDDIQPEIKSLISNFNSTSNNVNKNMQTTNAEEKSRTYFDGVVGAKPLSGEEIHQAVTQQRDRLEQVNKVINQEINNIVKSTKQEFKQEVKSEFKNIDFKQESINFSTQSVKNIEGYIPDTQANGNTEQNIKLLSA